MSELTGRWVLLAAALLGVALLVPIVTAHGAPTGPSDGWMPWAGGSGHHGPMHGPADGYGPMHGSDVAGERPYTNGTHSHDGFHANGTHSHDSVAENGTYYHDGFHANGTHHHDSVADGDFQHGPHGSGGYWSEDARNATGTGGGGWNGGFHHGGCR